MRICRFTPHGWPDAEVRAGAAVGALDAPVIVDLAALLASEIVADGGEPGRAAELARATFPGSTVALLGSGGRAQREAERLLGALGDPEAARRETGPLGPHAHAREAVRLLAPVDRPPALRDFFAFEDHMVNALRNLGREVPPAWYEAPSHYVTRSASVFGPDEVGQWPAYTEKLDYELEFAIVIGRSGRDIPPERAWDHIAGLTIFNDLSCRDVQRREMGTAVGPAKTKGFDRGCATGPYLVTADEIPRPFEAGMRAFVNGELWSRGSAGSIHWSIEQIVAHASAGETLLPGDMLGSGTVGTGAGIEIDRWIKPGDVIRLEIDGLGALETRVERAGES
ncbi:MULTISPECIES: fumarylacetoacetate hydrolase family protein [Nonomuraea]|uniref:Fumarylacetoacetate hydrolase family protein n=1 Tax=Nonomuraea ferruginea TaxID=46174 RepID=A0ABT4T9K1_9ACTN|nr:fumarylacetoacetate hydrolase family protein [Nonomuraea ferruginea]MDA0645964.1 fumarylacetoacetate hydrolase family protein [Nonomuraea ferruginea]